MTAGPAAPHPFQPDDIFYRLIPQVFIDTRRGRISPGAFSNTSQTDEMSVDWALLSAPEQSMARWPSPIAVGQFVKRVCDELQQTCTYQPITGNPAHCAVIGDKPESIRKRFARACQMVLWPDGWTIPDEIKVQWSGGHNLLVYGPPWPTPTPPAP